MSFILGAVLPKKGNNTVKVQQQFGLFSVSLETTNKEYSTILNIRKSKLYYNKMLYNTEGYIKYNFNTYILG